MASGENERKEKKRKSAGIKKLRGKTARSIRKPRGRIRPNTEDKKSRSLDRPRSAVKKKEKKKKKKRKKERKEKKIEKKKRKKRKKERKEKK